MILDFENCIQSSLITSLVPKESHRIMFGSAPGWVLCLVSIFSGRHVQATARAGTRALPGRGKSLLGTSTVVLDGAACQSHRYFH